MLGRTKDKSCIKCKKILDRKGNMCERCYLKSVIKARQRAKRDNRLATAQVKQMKGEIYDKVLQEVNDELDEEEENKKENVK